MVTCSNSEYLEQEIKPLISKFLADRGLKLSEEKTRVTHIREGFDFLGFNVRKYKHKCLTKPFRTKGNRHWVFSATDSKQTLELPLFDATKIIRHIKIKNLSNPYDKAWESYLRERTKRELTKQRQLAITN